MRRVLGEIFRFLFGVFLGGVFFGLCFKGVFFSISFVVIFMAVCFLEFVFFCGGGIVFVLSFIWVS